MACHDGGVSIELVPDEDGGTLVVRDGHPQSHVDLDDPTRLLFEYVQHLALVLDALPAGRLGVTHLGGAGLTLPRYVEHTRPGSPQVVLEPDAALTELVRAELPLPRGHRIRVRPVTGSDGLPALRDAAADVLVVDAYDDGRVPGDLVGADAVAQYRRVLRPGGVLLLNLADAPGRRYVDRVAATLLTGFAQQVALATKEVGSGRRFGNWVLAASDQPLPEADLAVRVRRAALPTVLVGSAEASRRASRAAPYGPVADASPAPPPSGGRRR